MSIENLSAASKARLLRAFRQKRPLVHCLTNEVIQEMTANVLLAAGASPAMVVAIEEAPAFAQMADALLINIGTPYADRLKAMHAACDSAALAGHPWVLDPVAAGAIAWRDSVIADFVAKKPTVIRGNASEIRVLAGTGEGGKGVDSTESSDEALDSARALALKAGTIVCVTGQTDYITDGHRTLAVTGGDIMATLVVGTGCSLSALVAGFCALDNDRLEAVATACALAKGAAREAVKTAKGPGTFHAAYLDALYTLTPETL